MLNELSLQLLSNHQIVKYSSGCMSVTELYNHQPFFDPFLYVANTAITEFEKCPAFHIQLCDRFERASWDFKVHCVFPDCQCECMYALKILCVGAEVWDLGHSIGLPWQKQETAEGYLWEALQSHNHSYSVTTFPHQPKQTKFMMLYGNILCSQKSSVSCFWQWLE